MDNESDLKRFAEWLVSLDEPGNEDRRTVTLTKIIEKAKNALNVENK